MLCLTEHYPGPHAPALPADLGADIALIERPGGGDPARKVESLFTSLRRNMRRIVLDLESSGGQKQLSQLSATADVLVEGCRPGVMHKFGSSYKEVKANRGLTYLSVTGFGQSGPYRGVQRKIFPVKGWPVFSFINVGPGYRFNYPLMISLQAPWRHFGVVSAILARKRTGHDCYIDLAMTHSLVSWMTAYRYAAQNGGPMAEVYEEAAYGIICVRGQQDDYAQHPERRSLLENAL